VNLPFFIARRYFFSRRNKSAINIITGISMLGYAVGALALIVLLSAMNGFEDLIFQSYRNYYPDLKILPVSGKVIENNPQTVVKIRKHSEVRKIAAVLEENAVMQYQDQQVVATIKGVADEWMDVVKTDSILIAGNKTLSTKDGQPLAWMAQGLVYKIGLQRDDATVQVMAPRRESVGVSQMDMLEDKIWVSGMLKTSEETDNKLLIVPLQWASELFDRDGYISYWEVAVKNPGETQKVKSDLQQMLGATYIVKDRYQQNEAVYKMFNTEKWVAFTIMVFVLLLISFNLVGALGMMVLEKRDDIKTLYNLGLTPNRIKAIFLSEGFLVAVTGTLFGVLAGIALVLMQKHFGFITTQSTFAAVYPVALRASDVMLVAGVCIFLGILSGIQPAKKAGGKSILTAKS
jgi:lipoprotein-releasing system permease protein